MVINVSFITVVGKTIHTQLPDNFSIQDFKTTVIEKIDSSAIQHYRFIVKNKDLCLDDDDEFGKQKHLIKNGTTIFLLRRMHGGGYVETPILIDIIIQELPNELFKLKSIMNECTICMEDRFCFKICCSVICTGCFPLYFKSNNLKLKCLVCQLETLFSNFFISDDFIHSLESLDEILQLMRHIDCQICHCGMLIVNETLYSKQTCQHCKRTFCFFCNKNWNDVIEKRRNDLYTCHLNCDYETKLKYDLIPYVFNKSIMIPNCRCCPKCFNVTSYDGKSKYQQCNICKYHFCFICMASKIECDQANESIKQQCSEIQSQQFTIFPRIAKS
ncbi:unnamed protein product [Rotaria socialis]|uniref:Uncharacterized protein n=1 Tax=Rotaria socialis TaxID=392032 RepID=A0A818A278_9BILA|nr:unnamed protein product [Rotaria socialis]CAF4723709.1 unnamed protein product [Rotaria socialis]